MDESITSGSSIRPVTGDQNRDDTLLSDSHIASSRTPYRNTPISLTWPLIITLVGCGGGGGGARPTIHTQTHTDDLGGIPDGLVFGAATDFFDEMERGFEQGETVNIEIPKNITLDRKGDSYHLTITNLPKGLEFSTRGDQYFIEGTVNSEPSSGSFTVHLTRLYGRPGEYRLPIHWTVYAAEPEIQGSLVNIPQTPETIAAQNPPQPRPDTNHPPIVRRDLPDITAEVGDGIKIDMRNYFLDPEKNAISFTAVVDADAPLPEGMQMQNRGSWLYGRPEMPGEYEITVTASDISEPPGQSETARQTFTLYVLHEDPRIVNVIDEQLLDIPDHLLDFDNRMIGSPIHKDIFDITANVEVETIGEFVQNQDKIFLGDTVTNVWISKGANGEWHLYDDAARGDADLLARVFIKAEEGAMPTLQPADFDAHSLDDDDFADVNVAVTIVQPDII